MSVPKLHPTVRYAEPDYWDSRYEREPSLFEWFFGHNALRRIIRAYVSKKKTVLQVGCGTSNMQEGMAKSGYTVYNTDISPVVINQMKERHAEYPNLIYLVSDCRNMPEFQDCQFGHVVDKGTMDALLCSKQGTDNVFAMLAEIHRVLEPGGTFLLVTLGDPTRRLPLLFHPKLQWKVNVLLLPKISGAAQAFVDGKPINDTINPIDADGPYEVLDANTIVGLPADVQYSKYFFAYVCKKQGLQLTGSQGQRVQLPANWVAGSKEVFHKLQKEMGLPQDLLDKGRRKRVMHVPAGAKLALSASVTPNSSSSSNAAAAAANLGVPVDIERILQEDQMHCQELTASSPSVAGGRGQHSAPGACTYQNQKQHQQQQQLPQQQPSGAVLAETKLDTLLRHSVQDQQQSSKSADHSGPASPAGVRSLMQMKRPDGLDLCALIGRSSGANGINNHNDASAINTGNAAARLQPAGQAPAIAEQMQQEQEYSPDSSQLDHRLAAVTESASEGAFSDSASLYSSLLSGPAQNQAPGWSMCPAAPRAPRSRGNKVPKIRRFSTECSSQSFSALQPQLAVLREQQAQHSERAADGLVMHDVPATEAFGSTAMSAAALAGAVWGHTRPPRNRRFSNMSTMSGMSVLSSASTAVTDEEEEEEEGEEEGGGLGAEESAPSKDHNTGHNDQHASQQQRPEHAQQQDPGGRSNEDGDGQLEQQQQQQELGHGSIAEGDSCSGNAEPATHSSGVDGPVDDGGVHQQDQQQQRVEVQAAEVSAQQQQQANCHGGGVSQLQPVQASDDSMQETAVPGIKAVQQQLAALETSGSSAADANGLASGLQSCCQDSSRQS